MPACRNEHDGGRQRLPIRGLTVALPKGLRSGCAARARQLLGALADGFGAESAGPPKRTPTVQTTRLPDGAVAVEWHALLVRNQTRATETCGSSLVAVPGPRWCHATVKLCWPLCANPFESSADADADADADATQERTHTLAHMHR